MSNVTNTSSVKLYVIFGLPGAGKGYCAQALKENKYYVHLSLGDFLRKEVESNTDIGLKYNSLIINGMELIPCNVVNKIIEKTILEGVQKQKNLIIDGFPRTINQIQFLTSFIKTMSIRVRYVILNVDPELALNRLLTRESCIKCGHDYIMTKTKITGICDLCGDKLTKRLTDNKESILKRIELFRETTQTILEDYIEDYNNVININANNNLEEVVNEFLKYDEKW